LTKARRPHKGRIVAVGDLAWPDKNFFSIQLAKLGNRSQQGRRLARYPGKSLECRRREREIQAFLLPDPLAYLWLKGQCL